MKQAQRDLLVIKSMNISPQSLLEMFQDMSDDKYLCGCVVFLVKVDLYKIKLRWVAYFTHLLDKRK